MAILAKQVMHVSISCVVMPFFLATINEVLATQLETSRNPLKLRHVLGLAGSAMRGVAGSRIARYDSQNGFRWGTSIWDGLPNYGFRRADDCLVALL